jgi:hypothetical protein
MTTYNVYGKIPSQEQVEAVGQIGERFDKQNTLQEIDKRIPPIVKKSNYDGQLYGKIGKLS